MFLALISKKWITTNQKRFEQDERKRKVNWGCHTSGSKKKLLTVKHILKGPSV
jgi:hypothetical protein